MNTEQYNRVGGWFALVGVGVGLVSDAVKILGGNGPTNAREIGRLLGEPIGAALYFWTIWRILAALFNATDNARPLLTLPYRLFIAVLPITLVLAPLYWLNARQDSTNLKADFVTGCMRTCSANAKATPQARDGKISDTAITSLCTCHCDGMLARTSPELMSTLRTQSREELRSNVDLARITAETQGACIAKFRESNEMK